MAISVTGPSNLKIVPQGQKAFRPQPGGFKLQMTGRRLTTRYAAQVTRFFHKAALGLMYLDHDWAFVLEPRFNEVRDIVRGADYHGYLLRSTTMGTPGPSVSFSYDFVTIDGKFTVLTWMNIYGLYMATDLLVRKPQDLNPPYAEKFNLVRF